MIFKKLGFLSFLFLLFAFLLSACKDDVVVPPAEKQLDTARYNWKMDGPIGVIVMRAWAMDTNNIFYLDVGGNNLVKYDGAEYLRYPLDNDFSARSIDGVSNTEIYIGGWDRTYWKPQVKCWNGSIFKNISIPDTFEYSSYVMSLFDRIPDVVWIGTSKGRVLKYRNGLIEETFIDTSQYIRNFMTDETGQLYFLAIRDSCNFNYTYCKVFVSVFKHENLGWQKVLYRIYDNEVVPIPQNLGDKIFASDYGDFYKFTGTNYNKMIDVYGFMASPSEWAGTNSSDLMCLGSKNGAPGLCGYIFYWNGKTWSDENVELLECVHTIINVQGKYVCTAADPFGDTYFYYGSKK